MEEIFDRSLPCHNLCYKVNLLVCTIRSGLLKNSTHVSKNHKSRLLEIWMED